VIIVNFGGQVDLLIKPSASTGESEASLFRLRLALLFSWKK
jgi:hypothetical protein